MDQAAVAFEIENLFKIFLPRGAVVIDGSANLGRFTVPLAHYIGEEGELHAFEPYLHPFQLLTANVALNGLSNVVTYQSCLGAQHGIVYGRPPDMQKLGNPSKTHVHSNFDAEVNVLAAVRPNELEDVEMVRLDDLHLSRIDLLRFDLDTVRSDIFRGAANTWQFHRPIIYIEGPDHGTPATLNHSTDDIERMLEASQARYKCLRASDIGYRSTFSSIICAGEEVFWDLAAVIENQFGYDRY